MFDLIELLFTIINLVLHILLILIEFIRISFWIIMVIILIKALPLILVGSGAFGIISGIFLALLGSLGRR